MAAAFGCAACNGAAAVLQKIGADKEQNAAGLDVRLQARLFRNGPYMIGVMLDLIGWGLTLYAVQYLPLFFVQSIIAASILMTAMIERFFRGQVIAWRSYQAIGLIVAGLVLLAFAAAPERAEPVSNTVRWLIVLVPVPVGLAGYVLARRERFVATIGLGVLSGIAFGGTSAVGRIFSPSQPLWHTAYSPLVLSLIATGGLGIMLFSIALQRAQATVVNATMTAAQTIVPALIGIAFLGDEARHGMWFAAAAGVALALAGVSLLTADAHWQMRSSAIADLGAHTGRPASAGK